MKIFRVWTWLAVAVWLAAPAVFGQRMFGGGPRDYGQSQLAKIFGKNQAFSATAEISVAEKPGGETIRMNMEYAFLNGNLRTELDMASMKGGHMSAQTAAQMKQMGMDRTVTIYRGDKQVTYLVYPGLKAYCEMTLGQAQPSAKSERQLPKVEITKLGDDTVDGHLCVKNKITITTDDGRQHEMLAWQATDLSDFPIKTEMQAEGGRITTHFRNIKLGVPKAALFEPPGDCQRYGNVQEMMMGAMQRMMGAQ